MADGYIVLSTPDKGVRLKLKELADGTYGISAAIEKSDLLDANPLPVKQIGSLTSVDAVKGQRALTGEAGEALSFELDDDGIPVLRVFDVDPAAYDETAEAIKVMDLYPNNAKLFEKLNFQFATGVTSVNIGRVNLAGYSKYYVLVRSDTTNTFKITAYAYYVGTFGDQAALVEDIVTVAAAKMATTAHKDVPGPEVYLKITRDVGEATAMFDVVVFGVR
jgi:hypothetical protein